MKVFISSVTYRLKEERNALPPFLRILDHEPLRFEDFRSQDRSSREACIAGVEAADVYLLLLGPRYGDPFPDTGLAPTHEEFHAARNLGIPILVFTKTTDEEDEPRQREFKAEVGHYVNGRCWRSFSDPMSLTLAVGEALKDLPGRNQPLHLNQLSTPVQVPWIDEASRLRPRQVTAPVLEIHLVPVDGGAVIGAAALAAKADALARDARASSFVPDREPLDAGSDNHRAWAVRPADAVRRRTQSAVGVTEEAWRGLVVTSGGVGSAFRSLPADMFGAVVEQTGLQRQVASMIALLAPHLGAATAVAVAARLSPAEQVKEGDPKEVGSRNSGTFSMSGRQLAIVIEPNFSVSPRDLAASTGDVAAEIATRFINDVRQLSS